MTGTDAARQKPLRRTPLYATHADLGARFVEFAGYEMPAHYPTGVLAEHNWTREHAGLFDISHMGQAFVVADDGRHETAALALEALMPADVRGLERGQQRYTQLLNANAGIIDDLVITRAQGANGDGRLAVVVNAARKEIDYLEISQTLGAGIRLEPAYDRALLALQGPDAARVMERLWPSSDRLRFMQMARGWIGAIDCSISRSGYTGEDGFEISIAADAVAEVWKILLRSGDVLPCGLGARDSLRLEAGLCLFGHELDETVSPVEAGLTWSIPKRRREEGGFRGAPRIRFEFANGVQRLRVGILPEGRTPARAGTEIRSSSGHRLGVVTSGGFSPTLKRPVAMGYVTPEHARAGTPIKLVVRGAMLDARVVTLPLVPHRYHRLL